MTYPATRTFTDQDAADTIMRQRNRTRGPKTDLTVTVDGPGDGEVAIMALREAVDAGFLYHWAA